MQRTDLKVLIFEDDKDLAQILSMFLNTLDFKNIDLVSNEISTKKILENNKVYDLIILDTMINNKVVGPNFFDKITHNYKPTLTIATSANYLNKDFWDKRKVDYFFKKPYSLEKLEKLILKYFQ